MLSLGVGVSYTSTRLVGLLSLTGASVLMSRFLPQRVQYYVRLATFLVGLGVNSVWGVLVSICMSLVGKSRDINWVVARSFHASIAPLVGFSFRLEGEEHLKTCPAVYVGNHQTMLDILFLGRSFPKSCSIMAKRELQWAPLLGQFMTLSNAVFINRSDRKNSVAKFANIAKTMRDKQLSLFIFPEGTRSASSAPTLLPFKKGAFHLAVSAKLPIVPMVCENYSHAYFSKEKRFNGGEIVIRVLPPISTDEFTSSSTDIAALSDKTRAAMLEALEDMGSRRKPKAQ